MTLHPATISTMESALQNLPELTSRAGFRPRSVEQILVKPNICGLYHPSASLLSSIIEFLSSSSGSIVIGETQSMIHEPQEQFKRLGVTDILHHFGGKVKAVDLSSDKRVKMRVPIPHALSEIDLPTTVVNSDMLVNVPKAGTHSTTRVTCALKNLFGLLPEKHKHSTYHHLGMDRVIADIAQVVKPELNIVEAGAKVIVGMDALTVDIAACRLLSLDPLQVEHLRLVSESSGHKLDEVVEKINIFET